MTKFCVGILFGITVADVSDHDWGMLALDVAFLAAIGVICFLSYCIALAKEEADQ